MRTIRLDVGALEVNTFEVVARTEAEPPQQVKTRCTACTQPLQCQWTVEA